VSSTSSPGESAKPERRGRPAGSRAHFLKLNAIGTSIIPLSLDPDAPHVIVRSYDDGPLESYVLGGRKWITLPAEDPLLRVDRADWDEMLLKETGVVRECLEHAW
jgi:hypothetical protein